MAQNQNRQILRIIATGFAKKAAVSSGGFVAIVATAIIGFIVMVLFLAFAVTGASFNQEQQNTCNQGQIVDPNSPVNPQLIGNTREEQAFHFFVNNGFTDAQAAGIVGNLMQESAGINPSITNSIGAHGIGQWMGYRLANLHKWAAGQKSVALRNPDNLLTQLTFVIHELNTDFSSVKKQLQTEVKDRGRAATQADVYMAADIWNLHYEISGSPTQPRAAYGWAAFTRYANQQGSGSDQPVGGGSGDTQILGGTCDPPAGAAGPQTKSGWTDPLKPGTYTHTGPDGQYGPRLAPFVGFHNGVDLAAPTGTPIYAAHSGVVVKVVPNGGYWGNYLVVQGGGVWILYPHEVSFQPGIHVGLLVTEGQHIGNVGATGRVTGPHLHLSVCTILSYCLMGSGANGKGSVNPVPFFAQRGVTL